MGDVWTPLAVDFFAHPKVVQVTPPARLLFVAGLCYSQRYLTDGCIPAGALGVLMGETGAKRRHAAELQTVGLWDDRGDGWQVHGWAEWNKPAEVVESKRARQSKGARWGNHKRWHLDRGVTDPTCPLCTDSLTDQSPDRRTDPQPDSVPDSTPTPTSRTTSTRRTAGPVDNVSRPPRRGDHLCPICNGVGLVETPEGATPCPHCNT